MRVACAILGVRLINGRPYQPQARGKQERFNGFADEFLEELALEPVKSVEDLNRKYRVWLDEGYCDKPHSALEVPDPGDPKGKKRKRTPRQAYTENPAHVSFVTPEKLREAFLWEDTRKVDKTGCIKFGGAEYDVGVDLIGKRVDVRYDPFDISIIEIWCDGKAVRKAEPLQVPEYVPTPPAMPAEGPRIGYSRLLRAYEKAAKEKEKIRNKALAFADTEHKGGDKDV